MKSELLKGIKTYEISIDDSNKSIIILSDIQSYSELSDLYNSFWDDCEGNTEGDDFDTLRFTFDGFISYINSKGFIAEKVSPDATLYF